MAKVSAENAGWEAIGDILIPLLVLFYLRKNHPIVFKIISTGILLFNVGPEYARKVLIKIGDWIAAGIFYELTDPVSALRKLF